MSVAELCVVVLVTLAGVWDAQTGRIPNVLTYSSWGVALFLAISRWGDVGFREALIGFAVGFLPFFLLYLGGGLGAGDVKLMAAIGAFTGYPFVLNAMIAAVLVGGLIALLIVIWEGRFIHTLRFLGMTVARIFRPGLEPEPIGAKTDVPFGVGICLGTMLTLISGWLGYATPAGIAGL
jgi:prepilin peptidase CpaA